MLRVSQVVIAPWLRIIESTGRRSGQEKILTSIHYVLGAPEVARQDAPTHRFGSLRCPVDQQSCSLSAVRATSCLRQTAEAGRWSSQNAL